ncbi:MAG TPA: phosphatase PAP2 family protein, partial [Candidatus Edwardsbacteria bacterium]|nr:phosphatase PAP2 family protein [Candidatus Edwardsbacteria bacterium]
ASYQVVMAVVAIVFVADIPLGSLNIIRHAGSLAAILALRWLTVRHRHRVLDIASDWYPVLTLPFTYSSTGAYIHAIFPDTIDGMLYGMDAWLLGTEPARFLQSLQTPLLSDLLQLSYCSFFAIIFCSALLLYLKGKRYAFSNLRMAIVSILYGTYVFFMLLPAHGPRFEYHQYFALRGGWITGMVNSFIGGAAYCGGAFPSGHAGASLAICAVLWRYERRWFGAFLAATLLLLLSTVYGGYHYIIDLVAGALFGAAVTYATLRWNRNWHGANGGGAERMTTA